MSPESFNAALAKRKLEAIDILLIQTKRGSDADRIRAASAILRIAFFPTPPRATDRLSSAGRCSTPESPDSPRTPNATIRADAPQAESLQVSRRGQIDESGGARSAAPGEQTISSPIPQGSYSPATAPTLVIAPTLAFAPLIPLNSS